MFKYSDLSSEQLILWLEILSRTMGARRDCWKSHPHPVRAEAALGAMFSKIWDCPRKKARHFTEGMWLCLAILVPALHPARISLNVVLWPFDKLHQLCQSSLGSPSLVPEGSKPHMVVIRLNYTPVCVWVPSGWKYFTAPQSFWLCFFCCTSFSHVEAFPFS